MIAFVQQAVGVLLIFNEVIIFVLSAGLHKNQCDRSYLFALYANRLEQLLFRGKCICWVLKFCGVQTIVSVNNRFLKKMTCVFVFIIIIKYSVTALLSMIVLTIKNR